MNYTHAALAPPTRILIVEDNAINLELVRDVLEGAGYEVLIATDGPEGLRVARAELPDLVLMDVQLPGIDGLEVTRRLKSDPATSGIRIIALTAHAMLGDDESMAAAGCDGYITKPIRLEPFRETVAAYVLRPRPNGRQLDQPGSATTPSDAPRQPKPDAPGPEEEGRVHIC